MNPRACSARDSVRGYPVNAGCRNAHEMPVEPSASPRFAIDPSGKFVLTAK